MKEMTTAEFAKANLAALEEPVRIRRYTKVVGAYYPDGTNVFEPPASVQSTVLDAELIAAQKVIEQLEEDNRHLKRQLAARDTTQAAVSRPEHPMKDVFAGLAKQDREFFERKLGKTK